MPTPSLTRVWLHTVQVTSPPPPPPVSCVRLQKENNQLYRDIEDKPERNGRLDVPVCHCRAVVPVPVTVLLSQWLRFSVVKNEVFCYRRILLPLCRRFLSATSAPSRSATEIRKQLPCVSRCDRPAARMLWSYAELGNHTKRKSTERLNPYFSDTANPNKVKPNSAQSCKANR